MDAPSGQAVRVMTEQVPPPTPGAWGPPPPLGNQQPPERPRAPRPLLWAAAGVFVLTGLFALNVIAVLVVQDEVVGTLETASPELTQAQIDTARTGAAVLTIGFGAVVVGLLVWFGVMLLRQRNWARIALTVMLAIGLIFNLNGTLGTSGAVQMLSGVTFILIAAVLIGLWNPRSSEYLRNRPR